MYIFNFIGAEVASALRIMEARKGTSVAQVRTGVFEFVRLLQRKDQIICIPKKNKKIKKRAQARVY